MALWKNWPIDIEALFGSSEGSDQVNLREKLNHPRELNAWSGGKLTSFSGGGGGEKGEVNDRVNYGNDRIAFKNEVH